MMHFMLYMYTGRPCLHAVPAVVFDQHCNKVQNKTQACCMSYGKRQVSKASLEIWRWAPRTSLFTGIQREVEVCLPEYQRDQSNCKGAIHKLRHPLGEGGFK